jgi:hypothetical protein
MTSTSLRQCVLCYTGDMTAMIIAIASHDVAYGAHSFGSIRIFPSESAKTRVTLTTESKFRGP